VKVDWFAKRVENEKFGEETMGEKRGDEFETKPEGVGLRS